VATWSLPDLSRFGQINPKFGLHWYRSVNLSSKVSKLVVYYTYKTTLAALQRLKIYRLQAVATWSLPDLSRFGQIRPKFGLHCCRSVNLSSKVSKLVVYYTYKTTLAAPQRLKPYRLQAVVTWSWPDLSRFCQIRPKFGLHCCRSVNLSSKVGKLVVYYTYKTTLAAPQRLKIYRLQAVATWSLPDLSRFGQINPKFGLHCCRSVNLSSKVSKLVVYYTH
jgi:hypothetical protein